MNPNRKLNRGKKARRGQTIVESTMILLVFLVTMISIVDFGQILFVHQSMVERVRGALRAGIVDSWDGTGDKIANLILYNQKTLPEQTTTGFLGLTRSNILVTRTAGTVTNPNDERVVVSIVNYQYQFFSPWIAKVFTNNRAIVESAPILYRQ